MSANFSLAVRPAACIISSATHLAGVIPAMARNTLLIVLGVTLVAAALVPGVGWVMAQPTPKAAPPADADEARKAADAMLTKLEKLRATLLEEIELQEKAIALVAKTTDDASLANVRARYLEADTAYHRAGRELDKLGAEAKVLKYHLADKKPLVEPDPLVIQQTVARDALVMQAQARAEKLRNAYAAQPPQAPGGAENNYTKELKTLLDAAEKEMKEVERRVRDETVEVLRASDHAALRTRFAKATMEIEIQTAVREILKAERDELAKLASHAAGSAGNVAEMRNALVPKREILGRIQQQIMRLRLEREVGTPPVADATEAKLDKLLKEVAALREEVRALKNQK